MTVADRPDITTITITELAPDLVAPAAALLALYLWPQSSPTEHQATCEDRLLRLLSWPAAQCFLARQAGVWAGFASINWGFSTSKGQPIMRIQDLYILPAYRRRGIAKALLQHMANLGRQHGANRLQLETDTQNKAAQALYSASGFERFPDKEIYMLFL
jgi:ribosomal protein S18 acetylase RimI-like enzyme